MENDFNVGNPTKENIEFAFKNLIFYITASTELNIYSKYKISYEKVLTKIKNIIHEYVNNESLIFINENTLQDIKYDLIDLDSETKELKSYFTEWSLLWLEAIISLRISEIKIGGANNGR